MGAPDRKFFLTGITDTFPVFGTDGKHPIFIEPQHILQIMEGKK